VRTILGGLLVEKKGLLDKGRIEEGRHRNFSRGGAVASVAKRKNLPKKKKWPIILNLKRKPSGKKNSLGFNIGTRRKSNGLPEKGLSGKKDST